MPFVCALLAAGIVIGFSIAHYLVDHASVSNSWIYSGSSFQIHRGHSPVPFPVDQSDLRLLALYINVLLKGVC